MHPEGEVHCEGCDMWFGADEYGYHLAGRKHKKRTTPTPRLAHNRPLVIPKGAAIILEQCAMLNDCELSRIYVRSLYKRIASRL